MSFPNITERDSADKPLNQLHTGHQDYKKTRTYSRYLDSAYINIWEEFYNGNEVIHHFRNPYLRNIKIEGTDGFQFSPGLSTDDDIKYFDEFVMRPISFKYSKQTSQGNVDTIKYVLDEKNYASKSKYFDPYNCPMLNISSVYETPIYVALPKYSGCILLSFTNIYRQ